MSVSLVPKSTEGPSAGSIATRRPMTLEASLAVWWGESKKSCKKFFTRANFAAGTVTVMSTVFFSKPKYVMKILVRLHQINAIVRSRGEHAARTINACAAAGLRDKHEC
jgi:hypothetical protein